MAAEITRWKDVVLNPCNRSVERRNTAAIRDALEALADAVEAPAGDGGAGGGDTIIFFQVAATAVGADSVAVTELVYNSGPGTWDPTGASYTAYDWSGSDRWKNNFVSGYYGLGRLNATVAADALEVISLEGKARLIQGTLDENMGATTTKQAQTTVTQFWGNDPNGRDPGTPVIIHDVTNMAPEAKLGDVVLAIWDEKRQLYVMIAPWKGTQTPGTTAIVRCNGGDAAKGCDSSSLEGDYCVHSGKVQVLSVLGDFCTEKFTDGASCWILDGRSCHNNSRLGQDERYVAVSAGVTFDPDPGGPSTDERPLYVVVDYDPAIRWYRVYTDAQSVAAVSEVNDLTCRQHDCGVMQDDDAPSVWGVWEDIDPCTRLLQVLDDTPTQLFFPMYRNFCDDDPGALGPCEEGYTPPDCRKGKHVPCIWNQVAERWDVITDAPDCESEDDVALIYVCSDTPDPDCCVYDALKINLLPRDGSYCDPKKDFEQVWMRCNTSADSIDKGFCELGVRICGAFDCNGDTRPVYLVKCGSCPGCECPDYEKIGHIRINVADGTSDSAYMDGVESDFFCLDSNPFVISGGGTGYYSVMEFEGLIPRIIYICEHLSDPPYTGGYVWIEVAGYGDTGYSPGDVMSAWTGPAGGPYVSAPIPGPGTYESGMLQCEPLVIDGENRYRTHRYKYGFWFECDTPPGGEAAIINAQWYWLHPDMTTMAVSPTCSGGLAGPSRQVIDSTNWVLTGAEDISAELTPCCANRVTTCQTDATVSCVAGPYSTITVGELGTPPGGGLTTLNLCDLYGGLHVFGGSPCVVVTPASSTPGGVHCGQSLSGCTDLCFEFYWPW